MIYQIKDWQEHFESAKSKTFQRCTHAYIPNKQDGDGYLFILSQPDGAAIYGCWQMLVMACSLQVADTTSPRQGYCTDTGRADGEPWTAAYLAMRWRRTEQEVQRMLDITSSPPVNWVSKDTASIPQGYSKDTKRSSDKAKAKAKALIKPKHITFPAPTAAPDDDKSHLEESIKETRGNPWGLWCVAFKAKGFNIYPTPQGPDLAAAKTLKKLVPDVDELYYCMEKYLRDDDRFLSANGWGLRHLPKRLDTYRINYVKAQAKTVENFGDEIPGETHDQGEFPKDEMDEIVAEAEKNHAR